MVVHASEWDYGSMSRLDVYIAVINTSMQKWNRLVSRP